MERKGSKGKNGEKRKKWREKEEMERKGKNGEKRK